MGVGASAGGLEAFSGLLANLAVSTGMAFVFVQHLLQLETLGKSANLTLREKSLSEAIQWIDEAFQEVRTISQLLHPPLLDEAGLISATRWLVDGFSARSKIRVNLQVADGVGRLPQPVELALFRVVQEALT